MTTQKWVALGVIGFMVFIAGFGFRGIYESQKPPPPKPAVSLGDAHKLGWLQGYSAALTNEKRGTSGEIRALILQVNYLRDSFATVNEFRATDEKN
jgi:hypothetical protein